MTRRRLLPTKKHRIVGVLALLTPCALAFLALASRGHAQTPTTQGQWAGPYMLGLYPAYPPTLPPPNPPPTQDLDSGIETNFVDPVLEPSGHNYVTISHFEVGAACVIPPISTDSANPGPYAGQVLVWNLEVTQPTSTTPNPKYKTHRAWIIDPTLTPPGVTSIKLNPSVILDSFFCSGFTWGSDGKLLTFGGDDIGNPPTTVCQIDPANITQAGGGFTQMPITLNERRFYPSAITLGDGMASVLGGFTNISHAYYTFEFFDPMNPNPGSPPTNLLQEQITNNKWEQFPRMFSNSLGRIFVAFDVRLTNTHVAATWDYQNFGTSGTIPTLPTGTLTQLSTNAVERNWGNAVIIEERNTAGTLNERVFAICGSNQINYTTPQPPCLATIDEWQYNAGNTAGTWVQKASGAFGRMFCNSVILPDETVFIVGGTSTDSVLATSPINYATPVQVPEIFRPDHGSVSAGCSTMASHLIHRMDHSTAVLLPDGRVFTIGGLDTAYPSMAQTPNDVYRQRPGDTVEIYSPPYLLNGQLPGIGAMSNTSNPNASAIDWDYGGSISVDVRTVENPNPSGSQQAHIVLMRPCATTHQVDFDQRYVALNWSVASSSGGTYTLTVFPPSGSEKSASPPGWYLLFYVSPSGIPSAGKFVKLH